MSPLLDFFKIFGHELNPDLISQGNINEIIDKSGVDAKTALLMKYYVQRYKLDSLISADIDKASEKIQLIQKEINRVRSIKSLYDAVKDTVLEGLRTLLAAVYLCCRMKNIDSFYSNFLISFYGGELNSMYGIEGSYENYYPRYRLKEEEEATRYIDELAMQFGLFKDIVVYEVGGHIFQYVAPDCHPALYVSLEEGGHLRVPDRYRLTLESWNRLFPGQAHITMSARVICFGSGMEYGHHSDEYCSMELLACFANLTLQGQYSVHSMDAPKGMEDPVFLEFIGLRLVEKPHFPFMDDPGLGLCIYQKVSNKTISKDEFDGWFMRSKYNKKRTSIVSEF